MEYMAKNIPLWQVTTWDKNFNNVDKEWQPKTIKYKYLLSDELDSLRVADGDVRILYTGKDVGYTTEELAGDNISEGEIVSIPWGGIPTVKYHKGKFVTGDNRIATSNDTSKLTNKYLYYYLQGNISEIASYYRGASLKHPCMKDVLKMTISYPSVQEQEKICSQFDMLEQLIEARKHELQLLDDLIKARFVEMFENGEYDAVRLGGVCTKITDGTHKTPNYLDEGITFISAKNIVNGELDFSDVKHISEDEYMEIQKRCQTETYDILLSKSGSLGVPVIVKTEEKLGLFESLAVIKYDRTKLIPEFLCEQLKTERIQRQFKTGTKGVAIKHLHLGVIADIGVIVPDLEEQNQFADFVRQVDKSKVAVQKALDETQTLFDSLMQEYFG